MFVPTRDYAGDSDVAELAAYRGGRRPSPYLTGNFTPLNTPLTEPTVCDEIEIWEDNAWKQVAAADLPKELRGAYIRVAPNPTSYDPYDDRYHWFDGDGLLHVVKLGEAKVTFNCDYVKTNRYELETRNVGGGEPGPVACYPRVSVVPAVLNVMCKGAKCM